jgi:hypothetical protein
VFLLELAGAERALVDLERGTPAVGGVREHVVNGKPAVVGDARGPSLVVRPGRHLAVASVDEHQAGGDVPASGDGV